MKAIVLGVRNGRAALLLEDGTTTYRRMNCKPGERVEISEQRGSVASMPGVLKVTAACAALFMVLGGLFQVAVPVSYITMDVNPSMEYALNRKDRVVRVSALNEDAKAIVDELSVAGRSLGEAVDEAENVLEAHGYLTEGGSVLFSVSTNSDANAQKLEDELSGTMDKCSEKNSKGDLEYSVVRVSRHERDEAKKLSMSAGRFKQMVAVHGESSSMDQSLVEEFSQKAVDEMISKGSSKGSGKHHSSEGTEMSASDDGQQADGQGGLGSQSAEAGAGIIYGVTRSGEDASSTESSTTKSSKTNKKSVQKQQTKQAAVSTDKASATTNKTSATTNKAKATGTQSSASRLKSSVKQAADPAVKAKDPGEASGGQAAKGNGSGCKTAANPGTSSVVTPSDAPMGAPAPSTEEHSSVTVSKQNIQENVEVKQEAVSVDKKVDTAEQETTVQDPSISQEPSVETVPEEPVVETAEDNDEPVVMDVPIVDAPEDLGDDSEPYGDENFENGLDDPSSEDGVEAPSEPEPSVLTDPEEDEEDVLNQEIEGLDPIEGIEGLPPELSPMEDGAQWREPLTPEDMAAFEGMIRPQDMLPPEGDGEVGTEPAEGSIATCEEPIPTMDELDEEEDFDDPEDEEVSDDGDEVNLDDEVNPDDEGSDEGFCDDEDEDLLMGSQVGELDDLSDVVGPEDSSEE